MRNSTDWSESLLVARSRQFFDAPSSARSSAKRSVEAT